MVKWFVMNTMIAISSETFFFAFANESFKKSRSPMGT